MELPSAQTASGNIQFRVASLTQTTTKSLVELHHSAKVSRVRYGKIRLGYRQELSDPH